MLADRVARLLRITLSRSVRALRNVLAAGELGGSVFSLEASTDQESASGELNLRDDEFGNIVSGVFTPALAKHSKSFNLIDTLAVGVDRIQRNFQPMQCQLESWWQTQITGEQAKLILYEAFVEGELDAPRSLLP